MKHEGMLFGFQFSIQDTSDQGGRKHALCLDCGIGIKHFQKQDLLWTLLTEVVPLVLGVELHVHVCALELSPDMVALDKIARRHRAGVAKGEWVVLDDVVNRPPNVYNADSPLQELGGLVGEVKKDSLHDSPWALVCCLVSTRCQG
jgi:hypothetical protein